MSLLPSILSRLSETANPLVEIPANLKGGSFKTTTDVVFNRQTIKAKTSFRLAYSWSAGTGSKITLTVTVTGKKDITLLGTVKQLTKIAAPLIAASTRVK